MDDIAIKVVDLDKSFRLPHEKQSTLKGALINFSKRGYEKQQVLKGLNFEVKKGEFLGILGRNGSGKSTLLKTLSGIYVPDSGEVVINGKLTPFIELGVGFNPELSGRDNVFLNGALLGFSRAEMNAIYDEIVAFAELEKFMDQKLKNYSSGMQVRLAFSIAIRANTDILVLDEVLAVGDEAFQRKCYDYFDELRLKKKTVILVTHDMGAVERFCSRAIVLNAGKILFDGDTSDAASIYSDLNLDSTKQSIQKNNARRSTKLKKIKQTSIIDIKTTDTNGVAKVAYKPAEELVLETVIYVDRGQNKPSLRLWFNNPGGIALSKLYVSNKELVKDLNSEVGYVSVRWALEGIFNDGKFLITAELKDEETNRTIQAADNASEFIISGWEHIEALVHPRAKVKITPLDHTP